MLKFESVGHFEIFARGLDFRTKYLQNLSNKISSFSDKMSIFLANKHLPQIWRANYHSTLLFLGLALVVRTRGCVLQMTLADSLN